MKWYHFYFHQIYTDFTANNKLKKKNIYSYPKHLETLLTP